MAEASTANAFPQFSDIVATPEMLNPRTVGAGDYKFQKIFSEGRFFASGMLVMPRGSEKPNKNSNGSAMVMRRAHISPSVCVFYYL